MSEFDDSLTFDASIFGWAVRRHLISLKLLTRIFLARALSTKANVIPKDAKDWLLEWIDEHGQSGTDFTTSHSKKDTSYGYSSQLDHNGHRPCIPCGCWRWACSWEVAFESSNLQDLYESRHSSHAWCHENGRSRMHAFQSKDSLEAQNHAVGRTRGVDKSTVNANEKYSYSFFL